MQETSPPDPTAVVLSRIESKLDATATDSKNWRKLENLTEPAFAIGLLMVATSIAVLNELPGRTQWDLWIKAAAGGLLAWWGVIFLRIPLALRSHFVDDGGGLASFVSILDDPQRTNVQEVRKWFDASGLRGSRFQTETRWAVWAYKVGIWWAAGFLAVGAVFSLTVGFTGLQEMYGTVKALAILAAILVAYIMLIYWRIRRPGTRRLT